MYKRQHLLGISYKLRMMGVGFITQTAILCDNQAVVINLQMPSSTLKKKHNAVSYHKCREAVAANIIKLGHIPSEKNISDVLTKALSPLSHTSLLKNILFQFGSI